MILNSPLNKISSIIEDQCSCSYVCLINNLSEISDHDMTYNIYLYFEESSIKISQKKENLYLAFVMASGISSMPYTALALLAK